MARILVGSTVPAFKMTDDGYWWKWAQNAEAITAATREAGHEVDWLAVLQTDARGDEPFTQLLGRLDYLRGYARTGVAVYRFSVDIGEAEVTTENRLGAICVGRNLIIDHALRDGHDWIYFADADIEAPDDVLVRLLELGWPVCAARVPTYCLDGPDAGKWARATRQQREGIAFPFMGEDPIERASRVGDVRVHWNTAGSLLVAREAFRRVPWRYDPDAGDTDDPATQAELERLGWPTLVRHDVVCTHWPQAIGGLERRGHDLKVYR